MSKTSHIRATEKNSISHSPSDINQPTAAMDCRTPKCYFQELLLGTHSGAIFCHYSRRKNAPGLLVGGWTNPSEKYARQIGKSSLIFGVKIKDIWVATT